MDPMAAVVEKSGGEKLTLRLRNGLVLIGVAHLSQYGYHDLIALGDGNGKLCQLIRPEAVDVIEDAP